MLYGTLFTLPSGTSTLASIGDYSSPFFDDLKPFVWLALGVIFALGIVVVMISAGAGLFHRR